MDMTPACRLQTDRRTHTNILLLYTFTVLRHTNTAADTQWDFAGTRNAHRPGFICLRFILRATIAERTSHSEELSIKPAQHAL